MANQNISDSTLPSISAGSTASNLECALLLASKLAAVEQGEPCASNAVLDNIGLAGIARTRNNSNGVGVKKVRTLEEPCELLAGCIRVEVKSQGSVDAAAKNIDYRQDVVVNGEHPLLNSVILDRVFKLGLPVFSFEDWKNFRMVCNMWHDAAQPFWRSEASLRIGPHSSIQVANSNDEPQLNYIAVDLFLEYLESDILRLKLAEYPFANITLFKFNLTGIMHACINPVVLGHQHANLWSYLVSKKPHIKRFRLSECILTDHVFGTVILKNFGDCERLSVFWNTRLNPTPLDATTSLMYSNWQSVGPKCTFSSLEISGPVPLNLLDFLISMSNLHELIVVKTYDANTCNLQALISAIRVLESLKTLNVLESRFLKNTEQVQHLANETYYLEIKLESLSLTLETFDNAQNRHDFNPALFNDVIHILHPLAYRLCNTLKVLKVFRAPIHQPIPLSHTMFGTKMLALTCLEIYGNVVQNFNFLKYVDELEELKIDTYCLEFMDHMRLLYFEKNISEDVRWFAQRYLPYNRSLLNGTDVRLQTERVFSAMTKLHLNCSLGKETVSFVARCMPNLIHFGLKCNKFAWNGICEHMPHLRELNILRGSSVDDMQFVLSKFNLLCLKTLTYFAYDAPCGESKITDKTVNGGLLKLGNLSTIAISAGIDLSLEAEMSLKCHCLNVSVVRKNSETCIGKFDCCKETSFLSFLSQNM